MTLIQISALFLVLITVVGWLNARFFRLSPSVAMLGAGMAGAVILLVGQLLVEPFWGFDDVGDLVKQLNFTDTVMNGMLGFMLFASGLQIDLAEIRKRQVAIWTLATLGVLVSTVIVGFGLWWVSGAVGYKLPLAWALAFGALISPTDPIAVLGAMRQGVVSPRLGPVLLGEALFNDGVGFVAFTTAAAFAETGAVPHPLLMAGAIGLEAGGGLVFGVAAAALVVAALRQIDDRVVEVIATVALAIGVYVGAGLLHLSGPIAAAAAGLWMGGFGVKPSKSEPARYYITVFWDVVDQLLNAALFLLLGLQVFVLPFRWSEIDLWLTGLVLATAARFLVVAPWGVFFRVRQEERGASLVLTWGGLRGAVSFALALSLPQSPYRDTVLSITFFVVAFSIVVQGLTFGPLTERLQRRPSVRPQAPILNPDPSPSPTRRSGG
jgi:CPA1 family monovalent cation:H+ antiporter